MSIRSEEYRRLAEDCLATAKTAQTSELRDSLTAMAERYLRLAERADRAELTDAPVPILPGVQPASQPQPMQQQQSKIEPEEGK